jgi:hypothetical protein
MAGDRRRVISWPAARGGRGPSMRRFLAVYARDPGRQRAEGRRSLAGGVPAVQGPTRGSWGRAGGRG